jgi:hypothetical protein
MVERLRRATNDHDLEELVACFAPDDRNETPAHPERGFTGREKVARTGRRSSPPFPDVSAEMLFCAVDGDTVWTEWEHRRTRPGGTAHIMRGVVSFGVADGLAVWARLYLEPVRVAAGTVAEAVRHQVAPSGPS